MLYIENLKASGIRNLNKFSIDLAKGLNIFYGSNGSGKTSILEAIYLLSMVKSFRSNRIHDVIKYGEDKLRVFAKGVNKNTFFTVGIEKGSGITRLKFGGEIIQTASEQSRKIPIYILTSEYQTLFKGTPKGRRHWLDWSLFHVEQDYLAIWKNYHRALRHRNALLKSECKIDLKEIGGLEKIMVKEGEKIDSLRKLHISRLNTLMNTVYLPLVLSGETRLDYKNHYYLSQGLECMLVENREEDIKRGFTRSGPHRTDVVFNYKNFNVVQYLSRGQTKLYCAALMSAQIGSLKEKGIDALVLVDDLDAELDNESSGKILNLLLVNKTQTFMSLLIKRDCIQNNKKDHAVFHVKHGEIQREEK